MGLAPKFMAKSGSGIISRLTNIMKIRDRHLTQKDITETIISSDKR